MKKLLHPLTRLLLAVGLSAFSVVAFAQKTAVNGIVTDAEGAPLVGATVIVMQNARPEGGGELRPTPKVNLPKTPPKANNWRFPTSGIGKRP